METYNKKYFSIKQIEEIIWIIIWSNLKILMLYHFIFNKFGRLSFWWNYYIVQFFFYLFKLKY